MEMATQERLPLQLVDDELRIGLNRWYEEWREKTPDGAVIDWILELPDWVHWVIAVEVKAARERREVERVAVNEDE